MLVSLMVCFVCLSACLCRGCDSVVVSVCGVVSSPYYQCITTELKHLLALPAVLTGGHISPLSPITTIIYERSIIRVKPFLSSILSS